MIIKISYDGQNHSDGVVSQLSWDNEYTKQFLRHLFAIKPSENIVGIDVSDGGIKAYIEQHVPIKEY